MHDPLVECRHRRDASALATIAILIALSCGGCAVTTFPLRSQLTSETPRDTRPLTSHDLFAAAVRSPSEPLR